MKFFEVKSPCYYALIAENNEECAEITTNNKKLVLSLDIE
ncbi:hypothetical protein A5816_002892 [Enterococcus sp. 3G1_DIV0629]|nr:hypothetical protein A5816_002892 [Enterococcus sp. 3G1_DIV0629]